MPLSPPDPDEKLRALLGAVREMIRRGRERALRAVDAIQVQTCWEIGRHIVEFEQSGANRAEYGKGLVRQLAQALTPVRHQTFASCPLAMV